MKYNTSEIKKRVPMFLAMLALAIMLILTAMIPEPVTKPDVEYPMANVNVTWEQSFHAGAWSEEAGR